MSVPSHMLGLVLSIMKSRNRLGVVLQWSKSSEELGPIEQMWHIIYINHNCQINWGRSKMLVYLYSGSDTLKGHLMAYSATLLSNTTHRIKRKINRLEWLCCSALKMAACCYCCWNIPLTRPVKTGPITKTNMVAKAAFMIPYFCSLTNCWLFQ